MAMNQDKASELGFVLRRLVACIVFLAALAQGATHTVCAQGCRYQNLQKALEEAQPGDTLVLRAGESFPGPFYLYWKPGEKYINIESSEAGKLPPPGHRVTPAQRPLLATIQQTYPTEAALMAGAPEFAGKSVDVAADRLVFEQTRYMAVGDPITCRGDLPTPLVAEENYYVKEITGPAVRLSREASGGAIDLQGPGQSKWFQCTVVKPSHHYRFRGIEFAAVDGKTAEYNLVQIGTGSETGRQSVPHHIEFRQVYIHGRANQNGPRNCLLLNGSHLAVRDSYISECKKEGEESKGISAWQAPGPVEIVNNYIEAASINVLFGGARPAIAGHNVGDNGGVVMSGNHLRKQARWKYSAGAGGSGLPSAPCQPGSLYLEANSGVLYECNGSGKSWNPPVPCVEGEYFRRGDVPQNCEGGACWVCNANGAFARAAAPLRTRSYVVKNLFEAKSLMNARITGNIFEIDWSGALSPAGQVSNDYDWNRAENVEFRNNIVRDSANGIRVATEGSRKFAAPNRKVRVINNLFYGISNTLTPALRSPFGRPISFGGECVDCVFEHNTVSSGLLSSVGLMFDTEPLTRFRFANNILHGNAYGINGDGKGGDCDGIVPYVGTGALVNNVLINNAKNRGNGSVGPCVKNSNYIDAATPLFEGPNKFRLRADSPYSASCRKRCEYAATTGKDLGVDIEEVEEATSGVLAGTPTWSEQARLTVTPSNKSALIAYEAPDEQVCQLTLFTNAARTAIHPDTRSAENQSDGRQGNSVKGRSREFRAGSLAPLQPGSQYWFELRCGARLMPGYFQTQR